MATYTTLEIFKKHVRSDDFEDDDTLLQFYLDAAEAHVIQATNRTAEELAAIGLGRFPKPLQLATYALAAHWYNQREAAGTAMQEIPYTVQAMVRPFRKLSDGESDTYDRVFTTEFEEYYV